MPELRPDGPRDDLAGPEAGPEPPFPIRLSGPVIKGFGRGSRELGIPTANIPPSNLSAYPDLVSGVYFGFVGLKLSPATTQPADNSKLTLSASASTTSASSASTSTAPSTATDTATDHPQQPDGIKYSVAIYPAVLSIGYNPFYANTQRSIEIHILHHFRNHNFYHAPLNLLILGFIRPEYDYKSLDALVEDIRVDCEVAGRSLGRGAYARWGREDGGGEGQEEREREGAKWLRDFEWVESMGSGEVEAVEARELGKGKEKEGNANTGEQDGDKAEGKL